MLEPAHLLALTERSSAKHLVWPAIIQVQQHIQKVQPDACHQHRRYRHQRNQIARGLKSKLDYGTFILAEQFFNPFQRDRIYIPGITRDVINLPYGTVVGRMKPVIHGRGQTQCDVGAMTIPVNQCFIPKQIHQGIGESLCL